MIKLTFLAQPQKQPKPIHFSIVRKDFTGVICSQQLLGSVNISIADATRFRDQLNEVIDFASSGPSQSWEMDLG